MLKVNLGAITTRKSLILINKVSTVYILYNLIYRIFMFMLSREMVMKRFRLCNHVMTNALKSNTYSIVCPNKKKSRNIRKLSI